MGRNVLGSHSFIIYWVEGEAGDYNREINEAGVQMCVCVWVCEWMDGGEIDKERLRKKERQAVKERHIDKEKAVEVEVRSVSTVSWLV